MPARQVNFEQMHEFELDYLFEHQLGKISIFHKVDGELYKLAKERFVSDLHGTHWTQIVAVISLLPLSYLLTDALLKYLKINTKIIICKQ